MPMIVTASRAQSGRNPRSKTIPPSVESPGRPTRNALTRATWPGKASTMSSATTKSSTVRVSLEAKPNIERR